MLSGIVILYNFKLKDFDILQWTTIAFIEIYGYFTLFNVNQMYEICMGV